ncbi:MAG: hypothetical protein GWP06_02535 [Actinobacteria bacterium]|nr:hypothetical protein [Actinomycetota bacterium]
MSIHSDKIPLVTIGSSEIEAYRFSHNAMSTVYEIYIIHDDADYAYQAAWEAFAELDRLEQELSRFIGNSDISRINLLKKGESTRVGPDAFDCIRQCAQIYNDTEGAFDVTVGCLYDCWLNSDKTLRSPSDDELQKALQNTGMNLLALDEADYRVYVMADYMGLDLGGFGKGYAIDKMAQLLIEWEIENAFIHGGTSSTYGLGFPGEETGWPISLSNPQHHDEIYARLNLHNRALSGSGLQKGQHIIDPRDGYPVEGRLAAWASTPDAATSDALSTAFMIMTPDEIRRYCTQHPETQALVLPESDERNFGKTIPEKDVFSFGFSQKR